MNKKNKELNILWLWPDILNQHGDRGNVMALARICGLYGIEAKITRVNRLTDKFDPDRADIALLGPGELAVMPGIIGAMPIQKIKAWTDNGGVLFATGTTGAAIGVQTRRLDGSYIYGAGLIDIECRERETVLGDDLIYRTSDDMDIYGIQIHMMDIDLSADQKPFGETIYGYGNNGKKTEGAVQDNVIFTNALGPVLVKNPWLTLDLINRALSASYEYDPDLFKLELESAETIKRFNNNKEKPK